MSLELSLVELLAHPAARLLTLALLHFLWQGLAIGVLLVAVVELCGIRRTTTRYALSLAALCAMLLCPLATLAWLSLPGDAVAPVFAADVELLTPEFTTSAGWLETLQPVALAIWLAGVCVFGGRLLAGAVGLSRLRRGRQPLPLDLASLVERLGRRMKMEALPLVFISRQVTEAMAVGLLRPLVLIPAAWVSEMPLDLLEAVIAHELAHLRRRDLWVNLLQRLAETVLFYHPAIWWLSRRLRTERELCADELAVAATGRRLEYAQALEQVAHRRQAEIRPALAAFMRGEKNMRVLERVRNVLGLAGGQRSRLWPVGIVALALPVALWAAAVGLRVATADEPKDGEKKVEAKFFGKDGEVKKEVAREGEVKKEGARDGAVKKEGPRDGEVKKEGARDGEVKKEVKKEVARDGEVKKEVARDIDVKKDGDRVPNNRTPVDRQAAGTANAREAATIEKLMATVNRLSQQVERLQAEVTALRSGKGEAAVKEAGADRREAATREAIRAREGDKPRAEGDRPREGADKPRPTADRPREGADRPRAEGDRPREGADKPRAEGDRPREGADKPRAEGERRETEIRKIEALRERVNDDKAAAATERELIAKKRAAAAEAEKRDAVEKAAAEKKVQK